VAVRADTAARALRCAAQLSDAQSRLVNSEAHNDALRAHFNCTMLRIRRVRSPTLLRRAPLAGWPIYPFRAVSAACPLAWPA
jgi:hypothetical protein